MSELEKKAKQLTDEELEQVTGGGNQYTDKGTEKKIDLGQGPGVKDEGSQGNFALYPHMTVLGPGVKDEGSKGAAN